MSSIIPFLGLPLPLFPAILPSRTTFSNVLPRKTCPIQFFFLFVIEFTKLLSSSTRSKTSSFFFLSFQLTFSHLLHTHISKASSLPNASLFIVHVSHPYRATGQIKICFVDLKKHLIE